MAAVDPVAVYDQLASKDFKLSVVSEPKAKSRNLTWLPNSTVLAVLYDDKVVRLWDAATGQQTQEITLSGEVGAGYYSNSIKANDKYLFVGTEAQLEVIDLASFSIIHTVPLDYPIATIEVVPGTTKVYLGLYLTGIHIFDTSDFSISGNLLGDAPTLPRTESQSWGQRIKIYPEHDLSLHVVTEFTAEGNFHFIYFASISDRSILKTIESSERVFSFEYIPSLDQIVVINETFTTKQFFSRDGTHVKDTEGELLGNDGEQVKFYDLKSLTGTEFSAVRNSRKSLVVLSQDLSAIVHELKGPEEPADEFEVTDSDTCRTTDGTYFINGNHPIHLFEWSQSLKTIATLSVTGEAKFLSLAK
mmetsp:Transcript_27386/g.49298  ORF Transcript_27386/g.49298 Transcript_27386/m.49298 type:complete len:360 (-) Transcript_27386:87-1166(-)